MSENPIKVSLINRPSRSPVSQAKHAGRICYTAETPEWGKVNLDVKNQLFLSGHHTTLEHPWFTFSIEGIPVGEVDFGLHLTSPHYNTDQRSGRYTSDMFRTEVLGQIGDRIQFFYPEVDKKQLEAIMAYVRHGMEIFLNNHAAATKLAAKHLAIERPYAGKVFPSKVAQEQLRVFVSLVFPTALDYSINLITLASFYQAAWTQVQRYVFSQMVELVCEEFPSLKKEIFDNVWPLGKDWALSMDSLYSDRETEVLTKPRSELQVDGIDYFVPISSRHAAPLDLLPVLPYYMDNSQVVIKSQAEYSLMTYGQDQRHRAVKRSKPKLTGNFYLPPLVAGLGLEAEATRLMEEYRELASLDLPETLLAILTPYGATVSYTKVTDANGFIHEHGKRSCFQAQEEIYHGAVQDRQWIEWKIESASLPLSRARDALLALLEATSPVCLLTGKCGEGDRFCGRDLRKKDNYFPFRMV